MKVFFFLFLKVCLCGLLKVAVDLIKCLSRALRELAGASASAAAVGLLSSSSKPRLECIMQFLLVGKGWKGCWEIQSLMHHLGNEKTDFLALKQVPRSGQSPRSPATN